jgi:hypothetical protein
MGYADRRAEQLALAAQEVLGDGVQVQVAVNGWSMHPFLSTGDLGVFGRELVLAATTTDLVLLSVKGWRSFFKVRPKAVLARYPRSTRVGDPTGDVHLKVVLPDGKKLYLPWTSRPYLEQMDATG